MAGSIYSIYTTYESFLSSDHVGLDIEDEVYSDETKLRNI